MSIPVLPPKKLNILVLFAGAGLATRGLLNAGHTCTDVEIDPAKVHLSRMLNPEATHIVSNVLDLDLGFIRSFDAVWASPPCQKRSLSNSNPLSTTRDSDELEYLFWWSQDLPNDIVWIENVIEQGGYNEWGDYYNAAQFLETPIQNRQRIIGGSFRNPVVYRGFKPHYRHDGWDICPAIRASHWKRYGQKDNFRSGTAEAWYGRVPTIREAAYHQGLEIPESLMQSWFYSMPGYSWSLWRQNLYEAIGNGVPVYMAEAFGKAYSQPQITPKTSQMELFATKNLATFSEVA